MCVFEIVQVVCTMGTSTSATTAIAFAIAFAAGVVVFIVSSSGHISQVSSRTCVQQGLHTAVVTSNSKSAEGGWMPGHTRRTCFAF